MDVTPCRIRLIGSVDTVEHAELHQWLKRQPGLQILSFDDRIDLDAVYADADFVIIFQNYSDQFGQQTVNRLIEMTLGTRVCCCYGPLCASDGRAFETWPVAMRVPVNEFRSYFEQERQRFIAGEAPLPPTASADELFTRWFGKSD